MLYPKATLLQALCLVPLATANYHDFESYVAYPEEAKSLLDTTVKSLKAQAPKVKQIIAFPGKDFFLHMQEVAVRNSYQNDLFKYEVDYMIHDGLDEGCREKKSDTTNAAGRFTDTVISSHNKDSCAKHCLHHGRYCPTRNEGSVEYHTGNHTGQVVMKEALRRMCMGDLLEGGYASPMWYTYLYEFDAKKCMNEGKDLNACSESIFEFFMDGFDTSEGSDFAKCIGQGLDEGATIPILENALDFSIQQKKYSLEELPIMEIGDHKFSSKPRADHVLSAWCSHFAGEVKPVACDFCLDHCNNQKNCLWHLSCDGHQFDLQTYKDPKGHGNGNHNSGNANTPASQPAPAPEPAASEPEPASEPATTSTTSDSSSTATTVGSSTTAAVNTGLATQAIGETQTVTQAQTSSANTGGTLFGGMVLGMAIAGLIYGANEFKKRREGKDNTTMPSVTTTPAAGSVV